MKKKTWIKVAIVVAMALAVIGMVKLLPLAWTLSAVIGFTGGVVCSYVWNSKPKK